MQGQGLRGVGFLLGVRTEQCYRAQASLGCLRGRGGRGTLWPGEHLDTLVGGTSDRQILGCSKTALAPFHTSFCSLLVFPGFCPVSWVTQPAWGREGSAPRLRAGTVFTEHPCFHRMAKSGRKLLVCSRGHTCRGDRELTIASRAPRTPLVRRAGRLQGEDPIAPGTLVEPAQPLPPQL